MRLRVRLKDKLNEMVQAHLPKAVQTVWNASSIAINFENLRFTPQGGFIAGWQEKTGFEGVVRASILSDSLDDLEIDPLIQAIANEPLVITPDENAKLNQHSEKARLTLIEMRDSYSETHAMMSLRFNVKGCFVCRTEPLAAPNAPTVGEPNMGAADE